MTSLHPTMSTELASMLRGTRGEKIALEDVAVCAVLRDLLAEVTVTQTYRNAEEVNIEAVYTFPLPVDAVLLDLDVEIGGRRLKGTVVEKKAAERRYEDAVADGDAAVMLELAQSGLYTMNVGNLLPGETAKIVFKYAMLHRWNGDRLRIHLPTTVAPRYGAWMLPAHQVPEVSLAVENRFALRIEVLGTLREARFTCPTHAVDLDRTPDRTVIAFTQERANMDRDFVLNVRSERTTRSFVVCGRDGDGTAVIASFQPFFPDEQTDRPLDLAIVVDCSGSMSGISMQQAKLALADIIDSLQPHDRVNLIAFGSTTKPLSRRLIACNDEGIAQARAFAASLDADMGGTEIGQALTQAYASLSEASGGNVLLLTDGQVGVWPAIVADAEGSGHRVFAVGVGTAVSEAFLREISAKTGGECELVSPREGMADRIVRHFERMRAPRAKHVAVRWPQGASNQVPRQIGTVFAGDTVVASAYLDRLAGKGEATLEVETVQGRTVRQSVSMTELPCVDDESDHGISTVARVAASMRMATLAEDEARTTALRYRLVSPWTNWLVVAQRAEDQKSASLPELRKVPQMLAAGWGGTGIPGDVSFKDAASHARVRRENTSGQGLLNYCNLVLGGSIGDNLSMQGLFNDLVAPAPTSTVPAGNELARTARMRDAIEPNAVAEGPARAREALAGERGPQTPETRLIGGQIDAIRSDPSLIEPARASVLLRAMGLGPLCARAMERAATLGFDVDAVAAILLHRVLESMLAEPLPEPLGTALAALRTAADRALRSIDDAVLLDLIAKALEAIDDAISPPAAPVSEAVGPKMGTHPI